MLPLTMADTGKSHSIIKIGGNTELRQHLGTLGFVVGGDISVVSEMNGSLIVNIKESRVAISRDMANKISVQ